MSNKFFKTLFILCLSIGLTSAVLAQEGSISGTVRDSEGNPLPGVTVTIVSESLMGPRTFVTTVTGFYRFPAIRPGTYTITAALQGFKTIIREEIVLSLGMSLTVSITLEVTTIEEEITVTAASPVVDVIQSKIVATMDSDMLANIPLARDVQEVLRTAPGAVQRGSRTEVHGSYRANTYQIDGTNITNPTLMTQTTRIDFDAVDEVEIITGGHPASVGSTTGAFVNVITSVGGNKISGGVTVYYTGENLTQHLWTDEQIQALGVAKARLDKSYIDSSARVGGAFIRDKLWFFLSTSYMRRERNPGFIPFTDVLGQYHAPYTPVQTDLMGLVKITAQITPKIKFLGMLNYMDQLAEVRGGGGPRSTYISRTFWDHEKVPTISADLNYILNKAQDK